MALKAPGSVTISAIGADVGSIKLSEQRIPVPPSNKKRVARKRKADTEKRLKEVKRKKRI